MEPEIDKGEESAAENDALTVDTGDKKENRQVDAWRQRQELNAEGTPTPPPSKKKKSIYNTAALVCVAIGAAFYALKLQDAGAVFVIAAIIIFAVGKLKAKMPKAPTAGKWTAPNRNTKEQESPVKIHISTHTSSYYEDRVIAPNEELTVLFLGGYVSASGGYQNWATYNVVGTNPTTQKKNKRRISATDEAEAIEKAKKAGLLDPVIQDIVPCEEPTERQMDYVMALGASIPEDISKEDVSAIISRIADSDDIVSEKWIAKDQMHVEVRPLKSPDEDFALFAHMMGVKFSRYIGEDALFERTVYHLTGRNKAAFFAYCVLCSVSGQKIGNMLESPNLDRLYAFGDKAAATENLMRSIDGREPDDYFEPHRGTIAFKEVAKFFHLKY